VVDKSGGVVISLYFRNSINSVFIRVNEYGGDGKAEEDKSSKQSYLPDGDKSGDDGTSQHCSTSADGMSQATTKYDSNHVIDAGEDNGGQLGAISPFGYEGQSETYSQTT